MERREEADVRDRQQDFNERNPDRAEERTEETLRRIREQETALAIERECREVSWAWRNSY